MDERLAIACQAEVWSPDTLQASLQLLLVHALHSLSAQGTTGGSEVPAYDRCYILATDIYVMVFRAVPIRIYYAVLIATPKPFFR